MSLNAFDDMVTFWKLDNVRGLKKIINEGLGSMMTHQMDKIARDAFLKAPFAYYKADGSGSSFADIASTDKATTTLLQDIQLGLQTRDNPMNSEEPGYGSVFCITTPGVIHDLRNQAIASSNGDAFIDVFRYKDPSRIVAGEVGTYYGTRFIQTNNAMLPNCGNVIQQTTVTAPINPGDGSPDPETTAVDSVEYVGQPGATHGITVADTTGFNVGDYVSIHKVRTADHGIANGADYRDGSFMSLRIVGISGTLGGTLSFERPILEPFTTDLGGGVYGYVTKGTHVHTMAFLYGTDGVAMGTAQPPTIVMPQPIDDLGMIHRVSWHGYFGYQPFNKNAFEIAYVAGSHRLTGPTYVQ